MQNDIKGTAIQVPADFRLVSASPERLASLITLSYEPMFAWRLDGAIEFWNTGAERLYGFAAEEAVGCSSHILLQTKFPVAFSQLSEQLLNEGFWSGELRHVCKDGSAVIVDSRMQLLADRTVLEANHDVTWQRSVEAELRETEQRLRYVAAIVESSDDAIVSKNLDGVITSWNSGAERIFGYTAREAVGQPITMVIPKERHDEETTILSRIRRGERIDHFETVRQRKGGDLIVVSLSVSPVKNARGDIVGASKIARDITEQKQNQAKIAMLAREAEHRSKNMLANVQAIVNLSRSDTPEGLKKAVEGRIRALANVHSLFVATRWGGADLSTIAKQEMLPYAAATESRVRIEGPHVLLVPDTAQTVAVTLHELATNAAKYGSLSVGAGQLDLTWSRGSDAAVQLRWVESGGPKVTVPTRRGFGSRVVEQMIAQLGGEVRFDWREQGLVCDIALPG